MKFMPHKLNLFFALLLSACCTPMLRAIDLQAIMRDTQRTYKSGNHFTVVWWIPQFYWEQSFAESSRLSPEGKMQLLDMFAHYNMVAVVDADIDALAAFQPKPEADVAAHSKLILNDQTIAMVSEADLPDGMKNLLGAIKPILVNAMGSLGKGMYLQIYPADKDPTAARWEKSEGKLAFTLNDREYQWKLPLPCVLPLKHDPKTGEEFPGDYKFNPYSGSPLK